MAEEVWEAVKEPYSDGENASQIFEIKTRLWQTKQREREVTDYYLEMTNLWQELDRSPRAGFLTLALERGCLDDSVRYKKGLRKSRFSSSFPISIARSMMLDEAFWAHDHYRLHAMCLQRLDEKKITEKSC